VSKPTLIAVVGSLLVAGCGQHEEAEHPVSWYLEHRADMEAKAVWCVDDAERQRTPDCQNATEAKRRSLVGSQKSLAPIDWGETKTKP
jgi:hypothetical protein